MLFLYVLLDHSDHVWFLVRVSYTISQWARSFWKLVIFPPEHAFFFSAAKSYFHTGDPLGTLGKMSNFQNGLARWEMVYGTRTKNQTWSGWSRRTYENNIFYEKTNSRLFILQNVKNSTKCWFIKKSRIFWEDRKFLVFVKKMLKSRFMHVMNLPNSFFLEQK